MDYKEAKESLTLKFTSGNDMPVTRSTITLEEWEAIQAEIERFEELEGSYTEDLEE